MYVHIGTYGVFPTVPCLFHSSLNICRLEYYAYFCLMKKIPGKIIRDYAMLALGFFMFFTLMKPWGMQNYVVESLWYLQSIGCCTMIFLFSVFSEAVVTYIFKLPCDYSKDWPYQIKRETVFLLILIIVLSAAIGQYFTLIQYGWKHWYYFWIDTEGNFTLKWYLDNAAQDVVWCIFVAIYWYFMTKSRMKEHRIQELLAINDALEQTEEVPEEKVDMICISGDSKESLTVLPSDILYIESVANYLSIWYFLDGDLKQKRIRNTLKSVEETLSGYPFLLHCHRAFMVNIRFITHVEGNSAGCQLHLFSTDRTIPVSKANIEALRNALNK